MLNVDQPSSGLGRLCMAMNRVTAVGRSIALAAIITAAGLPAPARAQVETIFIVPGAHFDVGFNDLPSVVREHRIQAVEDALRAAEADSSFHWMEDGAWGFGGWLERYRGDAVRLARARRALQSGQLFVSAVWVSPHGSMFHESLGLLTAHLDEMERLLDYRPQVAVLDDAPSHPEALVDALTARGVRYMLVGANMFVTAPLPPKLVRSPFWWESSRGVRALVYIDPNSYCQAAAWPDETDTTRFAELALSQRDRMLLATAERGFRNLLAETSSRYDALVFEHAGDDWSVPAVKWFPDFVRHWTAAGLRPRLVLSSPLAYFRRIETRYGTELPVYRGEWGGEWDSIRATCPVWTWRLREAMKLVRPDSPLDVKEALATAMDHGLTLGPGWPEMFTEPQTVAHAREQAQVFARAVEVAGRAAGREPGGVRLVDSLPKLRLPSDDRPPDARWREVLADSAVIRLRAGPGQIAPFIPDYAPFLDVPLLVKTYGSLLVARARIDRGTLPGADTGNTFVTLEFPLKARRDRLQIAAEDSRSALAGRWLRGAPPAVVVAPEGLRVTGLPHTLRVASPLAFSYTLAPDPTNPTVTWLQVLLVRQDTKCTLKGGVTKVLPFKILYPGEPDVLDTWVEVELRANASNKDDCPCRVSPNGR